jgi:hypothetical protein
MNLYIFLKKLVVENINVWLRTELTRRANKNGGSMNSSDLVKIFFSYGSVSFFRGVDVP